METLDEDECNILEHLSRLRMGLEHAEQKGCSHQKKKKQKTNFHDIANW